MEVAFLFDLDGVILDTEGQYREFWRDFGVEHFGRPVPTDLIMGASLPAAMERLFPNDPHRQALMKDSFYEFETRMRFDYVPGAFEFLSEIRAAGFPIAVVTSSNNTKMEHVYKARPELHSLVDHTLTPELFRESKPAPDCFLMGAELCGVAPGDCFIFEDSLNGLRAARAAGGQVVGLTTTNDAAAVGQFADVVIPDFRALRLGDLVPGC